MTTTAAKGSSQWPTGIWGNGNTLHPSNSGFKNHTTGFAVGSSTKPKSSGADPKPWSKRPSPWTSHTEPIVHQIQRNDRSQHEVSYVARAEVNSQNSIVGEYRKHNAYQATPRIQTNDHSVSLNPWQPSLSDYHHEIPSVEMQLGPGNSGRTFGSSGLTVPTLHKPSSSFAGLPVQDITTDRSGRALLGQQKFDDASNSMIRSGSMPPSRNIDWNDQSRASQSYVFAQAQGAIGSLTPTARNAEVYRSQRMGSNASSNYQDSRSGPHDLSSGLAEMSIDDALPSNSAFTTSNIEELVSTPGYARDSFDRAGSGERVLGGTGRVVSNGPVYQQHTGGNHLSNHVSALRRGYDPSSDLRTGLPNSMGLNHQQMIALDTGVSAGRYGTTMTNSQAGIDAASSEVVIYQQMQQLQHQQTLLNSYQMPQYGPLVMQQQQQQQTLHNQIQLLQAYAQRSSFLGNQLSNPAYYGNSLLQVNMTPPTGPRERNNLHDTGSALMQDFKSNPRHAKNWTLKNIANHVVEFSGDRDSSKFIQEKMESAKSDDRAMVFEETTANRIQLMVDRYGNYVIQKLFEFGSQSQKTALFRQMKGHVRELSLNQYGCRNVQKALEVLLVEQQVELIDELKGHERECVWDQSGNHVIQVIIIRIPLKHLGFIIEAFQNQLHVLATHIYGCRVVQRMLENWDGPVKEKIMAALWPSMESLIQDPFGNYVSQHIIEHNSPEDQARLNHMIVAQFVSYSKQKFASNVVEKSIKFGTGQLRRQMLDIILSGSEHGTGAINSTLAGLIKDQFANYVIRKS